MKNNTSPLPLLILLTLWPILFAVGGIFAFILLDPGEFRTAWLPEWPIPLHLALVTIAPAAALSVGIGYWIARSRSSALVFILVPVISVIITLAGIGLHYYLLNSVDNPLESGGIVVAVSLTAMILLAGIRR
jgi:hypothetical protein